MTTLRKPHRESVTDPGLGGGGGGGGGWVVNFCAAGLSEPLPY